MAIEIWTAEDLNNIRYNLGADYIQMADIDLSDWGEWIPIEGASAPWSFHGNYDGQNYKISNMKISQGSHDSGLFAWIEPHYGSGTTIMKNIRIENAIIELVSTTKFAGLLAGFVGQNSGLSPATFIMENVHTQGSIIKPRDVIAVSIGGIIGEIYIWNITIDQCSADINLHATEWVGGLSGGVIGILENVHISNSFTKGTIFVKEVSGENDSYYGNVAGFIGHFKEGTIQNCYTAVGIDHSLAWQDQLASTSPFANVYLSYENKYVFIQNCYYNHDLIEIYYLPEPHPSSNQGELALPRTREQMNFPYDSNFTFLDWDFTNIWNIDQRMENLTLAEFPNATEENPLILDFSNDFQSYEIGGKFEDNLGAMKIIQTREPGGANDLIRLTIKISGWWDIESFPYYWTGEPSIYSDNLGVKTYKTSSLEYYDFNLVRRENSDIFDLSFKRNLYREGGLSPTIGELFEIELDAKNFGRINDRYPYLGFRGILVLVNSKPVSFPDAQPSLSEDIYLIPMSAVIKEMGGRVYWDSETYIATVMLEGTIVEFFVNTNQVMVNGQPYTLEYIIPLEEDRTILHAEDVNKFFQRWRLKIENGTIHYYTGGIFVKKSNWINIPIKNYEYPDLEAEEKEF